MKKLLALCLAAVMALSFAACGSSESENNTNATIAVISREDGSGTRSAFEELLEIEETTLDADITNSTSVMMTSVSGNSNAIGYISMGSLNDSVKAIKINDVEASIENIKNGSYIVSRPFNIATKEEISEVAQDFIDFILSSEGQAVVEEAGYIPLDETSPYSGSKPAGKIVVAGSSSVTPVMEKLKEAYTAVNSSAEIEIQQSDSSSGMNNTVEGVCDIGMASRDLKDSELEKGLVPTVIATDGIAIIVNNENTVDGLTAEQVKNIYVGEITNWDEIA